MSKFNHFILTRFNAKSTKKNRPNHVYLQPEWLEARLKLFDRFCYPSVRAQSNQNFKWIVFFNQETPEDFKQKIERYAAWSNFIPAYISSVFNDIEDPPEEVRQIIKDQMTGEPEYIITSRLDSDDAICSDFIAMVQENFREQDCLSLNFLYGYLLHDGNVYLRRYPAGNPFISLVEKPDSFQTIFQRSHHQLFKLGEMKVINNRHKPAWLQIYHDRNIFQTSPVSFKYTMSQSIRQPTQELLRSFSIDQKEIPVRPVSLKFQLEQLQFLIQSTLSADNKLYRLKTLIQVFTGK